MNAGDVELASHRRIVLNALCEYSRDKSAESYGFDDAVGVTVLMRWLTQDHREAVERRLSPSGVSRGGAEQRVGAAPAQLGHSLRMKAGASNRWTALGRAPRKPPLGRRLWKQGAGQIARHIDPFFSGSSCHGISRHSWRAIRTFLSSHHARFRRRSRCRWVYWPCALANCRRVVRA